MDIDLSPSLDEPRATEPPVNQAAMDAEEIAYHERVRFNEEVAAAARRLHVQDAARVRFAAERVVEHDFDSLFLDRSQLHNLPSPEPLIGRILPRHAYAILSGRDQSFKSFVAVDWACCLATGKPWQAHVVTPVRVLYIVGEGAHGIGRRIDAWEYAWGHTIAPDALTVRKTALNLHQPGPAFDHLLALVETGHYGLVIVDTLRRVSGAADGNGSEMGLVVDNLDRLKHATDEGTVLVVAHTDKGDHDTRGYSGIEDDADVVWHVKRDEMLLTLDLKKMKDGPDGRQLHLQANTTLDSLTLSGLSGPPIPNTTDSQAKILAALAELAIDGMPGGQLFRATGLPESTFYRALKELHQAGHITNIGTPKAKVWALPALDLDSQALPDDHTPPDQDNSHHSHDSQDALPLTPTTPTTLRSGSSESESESNPNNTTEAT